MSEQLPNPEQYREPLKWSCEACGADWDVNDDNTYLFIYPQHPEFTFAQFDCEDSECENSAKFFLDSDSTDMLAKHITNIYPQYDVPNWVIEGWKELNQKDGVIEVPATEVPNKDLEEAWSYFWKYYNPQPWEFKP